MVVTSTELKTNLGKYLDLLDSGDIIVTRNGHRIAKIVKAEDDTLASVQSLYGILANTELAKMGDAEIKDAIGEERAKRYERLN
jgi:prevent-host-death family protein